VQPGGVVAGGGCAGGTSLAGGFTVTVGLGSTAAFFVVVVVGGGGVVVVGGVVGSSVGVELADALPVSGSFAATGFGLEPEVSSAIPTVTSATTKATALPMAMIVRLRLGFGSGPKSASSPYAVGRGPP
jgi:hypothetical protein